MRSWLRSCGCFREVHRDKDGLITHVDEGWCPAHTLRYFQSYKQHPLLKKKKPRSVLNGTSEG